MPNLPGSSPALDAKMFDDILSEPNLQVDQWKIYPCEITPWTSIKKWFDEGKFVPYPDEQMENLIMNVKAKIHYRIRINRVMRDIPSQYILGGINNPNIREYLHVKMEKQGRHCKCIRCREIKGRSHLMKQAKIYSEWYEASGSEEVFISYEVPAWKSGTGRRLICAFVRLRLPPTSSYTCFPTLKTSALVRELHVYGQLVTTSSGKKEIQHTGMGKSLMRRAEKIATRKGYTKMTVIAGVGARDFYRKIGYTLNSESEGQYMIKTLYEWKEQYIVISLIAFLLLSMLTHSIFSQVKNF